MVRRQPHPLFAGVVERCRLKPGVSEDHLWGETIFRVRGRVFAFLGRPHRAAVTVKPPADDVERLLRHPHVKRARYVGRFGWLTVKMRDEESLRLALDLVDESYRNAVADLQRQRVDD
jgi:predicted DNA-binding protein (MmcQ/YjbR family)